MESSSMAVTAISGILCKVWGGKSMLIAHVFRQAYYSLLMAPIMYFIEDRSLLTQEWHKWKIALKEVLYWGFGISYNSEEKILFLVGIFSFELNKAIGVTSKYCWSIKKWVKFFFQIRFYVCSNCGKGFWKAVLRPLES